MYHLPQISGWKFPKKYVRSCHHQHYPVPTFQFNHLGFNQPFNHLQNVQPFFCFTNLSRVKKFSPTKEKHQAATKPEVSHLWEVVCLPFLQVPQWLPNQNLPTSTRPWRPTPRGIDPGPRREVATILTHRLKKNEQSSIGKIHLVGGWTNPFLKNKLIKLDSIFARFGVKIKNIWVATT